MIEWIEDGELKNDLPKPPLKKRILKALIIFALLIVGPVWWKYI